MGDDGARTPSLTVGLNAAVIALSGDEPQVLVVRHPTHPRGDAATLAGEGPFDALPFGPLDTGRHRTLEAGLRSWVADQTGLQLDYVEQLYTFGDAGRDPAEWTGGPRGLSIGYLAVVTPERLSDQPSGVAWQPVYSYFPWEDRRLGARTERFDALIRDALLAWQDGLADALTARQRRDRLARTFAASVVGEGDAPAAWNDERVLERYELLYEAGCVAEAPRDGARRLALTARDPSLGRPMILDHRRILATALSRLRAKIKYRPVIFDLMPREFTLAELQGAVEAVTGLSLHKPNFRRLVRRSGLVEATGRSRAATGGRPAELFRYRADVVADRLTPGARLPAVASAREAATREP